MNRLHENLIAVELPRILASKTQAATKIIETKFNNKDIIVTKPVDSDKAWEELEARVSQILQDKGSPTFLNWEFICNATLAECRNILQHFEQGRKMELEILRDRAKLDQQALEEEQTAKVGAFEAMEKLTTQIKQLKEDNTKMQSVMGEERLSHEHELRSIREQYETVAQEEMLCKMNLIGNIQNCKKFPL